MLYVEVGQLLSHAIRTAQRIFLFHFSLEGEAELPMLAVGPPKRAELVCISRETVDGSNAPVGMDEAAQRLG